MKLVLLLVIAGLVLVTPYPTQALDATSTASSVKDKLKQRLEEAKEKREAFKEKREERKEANAQKREALKEQIQQRREGIQEKQEERKQLLEKRLQAFKDKKKAEVTQRVSNNLNKINQNRTDHFTKFLEKTSNILSRLEDRVNKAKENGKDTTEAQKAIDAAKAAIIKAEEAVAAQSGKDYTLAISDETKVKLESKTARDNLLADLKKTREVVAEAKKAVADAIRVAATTLGGKGE